MTVRERERERERERGGKKWYPRQRISDEVNIFTCINELITCAHLKFFFSIFFPLKIHFFLSKLSNYIDNRSFIYICLLVVSKKKQNKTKQNAYSFFFFLISD